MRFSRPPGALLIGDWHRREFREAIRLIRARTELVAVATIDDATRIIASGFGSESAGSWPEVVVIAQARPGRFSSDDVARLKRLAPLTRILGLLGSWCEGETRTGKPWPAVDRSFWYQWVPRFESALDRVVRGLCSEWGLPETASAAERTLWAAAEPLPRRTGTVVVSARSADTADAVGDVCRAAGFTPWSAPVGCDGRRCSVDGDARESGAVAAIWEGTQCEGHEAEQLARFGQELGGVPIVALLDFPRLEGHDRAVAAGAASVVGKPFQLGDLLLRLDQAIGSARSHDDSAR